MSDPAVAELLVRAESELTRNPRQALELGREAWNRIKTGNGSDQVWACRLCLGWAHFYLSLAGEAAVHFNDALDGALKAGNTATEIRARIGLGSVYRQLGRFDTALDHLSQAWRRAEASGDEVGEMKAGITIGEVYLALERPQDALECFFRARTLAHESRRKAELVDIFLSLGQTFQTLKRNTEALEQLSRALVLAKDTGNRIGEARALTLIGLLYRDSGELEISEEYHLECLKICQAVNHPWGQLDAYYNLGDLHALRGLRDRAMKEFEKVAALALSLDAKSHQVKTDLRMAELWERSGDLGKALETTRRALHLERNLKAEEASRNVRTLLDQFQAEILRLRSEKLEAESQELKKALDSLRVISELGRRITSSLTVSGLFQTLYESLGMLFELPAFGLGIFDPKDQTMRYPFRMEDGKRVAPQGRRAVEGTISGWAVKNHKTVLIRDYETDAPAYLTPGQVPGGRSGSFRSAVFLPLFAGDDPIGVLTIQHRRVGAYDEVHSRFLETLGGFVVVALRNALSHRKVRRLNRQILRLAHYDPLTGLANRRLLTDYLKRTIAISQRRQRRFAVFFLDLDGFKPVNDRWGHETGDRVLAELGERLSSVLRDSDLVARVGGDEFVALALDVDEVSAIEAIAQKLLEAVRTPFSPEESPIQLGVSIGIAIYPDTATDAQGLMSRADHAMYRVKTRGKDGWILDDGSESG
ncbi:MAG TPA: diguanylate cyclase [Spirochaetia bacterium]|nr:diguanylate cyclase [Spirochaetia bacterium]